MGEHMLSEWDTAEIMYWLKLYGFGEPTEAFWNRARQYGLKPTMCAIRKAAQEQKCSMQHVTDIIGQIIKEGNQYVYKRN